MLPRTKIAGRYPIVSLAGRGGKGEVYRAGRLEARSSALEQALVERDFLLAWLPVRRGAIELMSLESDRRWPVFIEKVEAVVEAAASTTNYTRLSLLPRRFSIANCLDAASRLTSQTPLTWKTGVFMPDFDTAWKEALEALFEPFMAFFFIEAHDDIDWTRKVVMLDKELEEITPKSEQGRRVVDKLVKVWRTNGQDEWVLVHIEVQSQPETEFAKRMYVYNYRLFDRYNRKVASFAILGDDRPGWRPQRFGYELWGTKVGIEFATAKLLDHASDEAALEADPNPFAVVVLAHLKALAAADDDEARQVSEVRLVRGLYERGVSAEQIRQLYQLIDRMMKLPEPLADLAWREIRDFEREKSMPFITGAQRVERQEGLAEGLAQGRQEAREGLLAGIEELLDVRFGPAGLALLPEIRPIEDLDMLRKILHSVKRADSPEALRRLSSKP